jgi:hypothetical protein
MVDGGQTDQRTRPLTLIKEGEGQDKSALDWYSFAHFGYGFATGYLGLGIAGTLGAAVAYEVVEQKLLASDIGPESWNEESLPNQIADVLLAGAGWALARWIRR